jgi:hypothetical protein
MARGYTKSNSEAIASEMRASGVSVVAPRQPSVAEYFKDKPNRSLKGLYKEGMNIDILDNTGKFTAARVMSVKDKSISLFPIFKLPGVAPSFSGQLTFNLERGPDKQVLGLRNKEYKFRAGL